MDYGYVRATAITPKVKVADVQYNAAEIIGHIRRAAEEGADLAVFPELCITGYTCGDLFFMRALTDAAAEALLGIAAATADCATLVFLGLPLVVDSLVYNAAACVYKGEILGFVPKTYLPNYNEFYEKRNFAACPEENRTVRFAGKDVPFGRKILFRGDEDFIVAAEICEDIWVISPPSCEHAQAGARIVVNLSCSNEIIGKSEYRRKMVTAHAAKIVAGYVYASSGDGESTGDLVFSGHNIISENGKLLAESKLFENGAIAADIDAGGLAGERTKMFNRGQAAPQGYLIVDFNHKKRGEPLSRKYDKLPFVPSDAEELARRAELIMTMQTSGLAKRVEHTNAKKIIVGVSGGLDSTLALIIAVRTMKKLGRENGVLAVTMPCFGTTERTYSGAVKLARALGAELRKIDISAAVTRHLKDISHPMDVYDAAYENAQARERTQVLMDIANAEGGLVLGTGDLSESALGWSTYNGDHMSMYGINSSVPKTLIRHIVAHVARNDVRLRPILRGILETPVSPELLPAADGEISQKTEEIVGPYELHDFFLYHFIRSGFSPSKILYLAERAFGAEYSRSDIVKWMKVFFSRFFSQQFKRSCSPDGIKIGTVSLSPRGDWRMPSDASAAVWTEEIDAL